MAISGETAYHHATVTVSTTVVALDIPANTRPNRAVVQSVSGTLAYKYTGGAPASADGHLLPLYSSVTIEGEDNIRNFRAIRNGSTNAAMSYTLERW